MDTNAIEKSIQQRAASEYRTAARQAGAGKKTVILLADGEPELMYGLADHLCVDLDEVAEVLGRK